jgi:hypothetical protein
MAPHVKRSGGGGRTTYRNRSRGHLSMDGHAEGARFAWRRLPACESVVLNHDTRRQQRHPRQPAGFVTEADHSPD